jgi:hypothetical protein
MTEYQWDQFQRLRISYKAYVDELRRALPQLPLFLTELIGGRSGPSYPLETPVVYNHALDDIQKESTISVILVADNPGRREQSAAERRYLVGPSGKLADGFFKKHPELGIDFRRNVLILNKTPIHTPRTVELRDLARRGGPDLAEAIRDSQVMMARFIYQCHQIFAPEAELWIIGYSEMGPGKLFEAFTDTLRAAYAIASYGPDSMFLDSSFASKAPAQSGITDSGDTADNSPASKTPALAENSISRQKVYLYRHFSMNQFSVDFIKQQEPGESTHETLHRIGSQYRKRILGW